MSLLQKVSTGKRGRAQKVVVYAPEGFGKSTLGSQFPDPFFLDIEDSTSQLDVRRLGRDVLPDLATFESALDEIAATRPCATVVIDTIDWLETLGEAAIVLEADNKKIKCVEDFGYGKGWVALKDRLTVTLSKMDRVIAAGIHVVLLAHSKVAKFEPPDGAGPYDRYELKLSKHVAPLVKEWADMLLFANWKTQVRERDRNEMGAKFKAAGGRERVIYCNRTAAWDAKNRHGMADEERWGESADEAIRVIEKAFRSVGAPWGGAVDKTTTTREPEPAAAEAQSGAVASPQAEAAPVSETVATFAENGFPAAIDPEIERICEPHSEAITAFLRKNKRIQPTESWLHMPADYAARVKRNPAQFLKLATASGNGK